MVKEIINVDKCGSCLSIWLSCIHFGWKFNQEDNDLAIDLLVNYSFLVYLKTSKFCNIKDNHCNKVRKYISIQQSILASFEKSTDSNYITHCMEFKSIMSIVHILVLLALLTWLTNTSMWKLPITKGTKGW